MVVTEAKPEKSGGWLAIFLLIVSLLATIVAQNTNQK
jgi:hypothetical protein